MNVKAGVNFHNRFDIEVRDAKTGKLKQKGQAENIVLDRMYERLCNFNSYFDYIHFGQGTGTLDPSRNTLFNKLGYKSATTEETIKAFPVSKWTRKITLNPEEYVGYKITEVGISDSSSYINTHALVKDAEGNPLSIDKTDTDVIVIYATVFIELQENNENVKWTGFPNSNALINHFTGLSFKSNYVTVTELKELPDNTDWLNTYPTNSAFSNCKEMSFKSDVQNRKMILSYRYGINNANFDLRSITIGKSYDSYRNHDLLNIKVPAVGIYEGYDIVGEVLGTGDGVNTCFDLKHEDISDPVIIYVDGVPSTDYVLHRGTPYNKNILRGCVPVVIEGITFNATCNKYWFGISSKDSLYISMAKGAYVIFDIGENNANTMYNRIEAYNNTATYYARISCCDTIDGDYTVLLPRTYVGYDKLTKEVEPGSGRYIKIEFDEGYVYMNYLNIYSISHSITFNNPPPEGAVITADYKTTTIPKSEDYVLDVTAEIQFGEGV